jgi:hypothetical protein
MLELPALPHSAPTVPSRFWTSYSSKFRGFQYVDRPTARKFNSTYSWGCGKNPQWIKPFLTLRVLAFCRTRLQQRMSVGPGATPNLKERAATQPYCFHKAFPAMLSFNYHLRTTQFRNNRMCIADAVLASMQGYMEQNVRY